MGQPPSTWDRTMMARLVAGDDSALGLIFDQYGALVHGIAARLVGADAAADITQEVFLKLWENPKAFDADVGGLRPFLAVMARRRAIDTLRRTGRRAKREQRSVNDPVPPPNVEQAAMALVDAGRLKEAVRHLPPDQARAIELAYYEGLTFKEVAAVTGASEGTAKSRLRLGLGRLARELAPAGGTGISEWI
ncbi:MAG: sigma-70 family RNA polymerase sigma factor [Acidimicrobiales bacterium]